MLASHPQGRTTPAARLEIARWTEPTGAPCTWVVGDCVCGADHQTLRLIEAHGRGYVLAVTSAQQLQAKACRGSA